MYTYIHVVKVPAGRENVIHTAKYSEQFGHFIKRIHNIDIKQILADETTTIVEKWDTKEPKTRQDFNMGHRTDGNRNIHQKRVQHGP